MNEEKKTPGPVWSEDRNGVTRIPGDTHPQPGRPHQPRLVLREYRGARMRFVRMKLPGKLISGGSARPDMEYALNDDPLSPLLDLAPPLARGAQTMPPAQPSRVSGVLGRPG